MSALEPFLQEAMRHGVAIDLHLLSGHTFTKVRVTGMLRGTAELQKTVTQNKKQVCKQYVVDLRYVVWAVQS